MAKAQAAAFQALNLLSNKEGTIELGEHHDLNLESRIYLTLAPPTRIVKVMNLIDSQQVRLYTEKDFNKILDDFIYECSKSCDSLYAFIVRNSNATIGAEAGSIFVLNATKQKSVELIRHMRKHKYNGREYKMICVPEDTYRTYFAPLDPKAPPLLD